MLQTGYEHDLIYDLAKVDKLKNEAEAGIESVDDLSYDEPSEEELENLDEETALKLIAYDQERSALNFRIVDEHDPLSYLEGLVDAGAYDRAVNQVRVWEGKKPYDDSLVHTPPLGDLTEGDQ